MIDDHSRLLVGSYVYETFKAKDVVTCLLAAISTYGAPRELLTDNGAVFTRVSRTAGPVALERTLAELSIAFTHPALTTHRPAGKSRDFIREVVPVVVEL